MDERTSYLGPNSHVCTAFVFLNVVCHKIPNNALTPQNLQKTENYEIETMLEFERQQEVCGFDPRRAAFLCGVCMFSLHLRGFFAGSSDSPKT